MEYLWSLSTTKYFCSFVPFKASTKRKKNTLSFTETSKKKTLKSMYSCCTNGRCRKKIGLSNLDQKITQRPGRWLKFCYEKQW